MTQIHRHSSSTEGLVLQEPGAQVGVVAIHGLEREPGKAVVDRNGPGGVGPRQPAAREGRRQDRRPGHECLAPGHRVGDSWFGRVATLGGLRPHELLFDRIQAMDFDCT
jgi:hypothetical protein